LALCLALSLGFAWTAAAAPASGRDDPIGKLLAEQVLKGAQSSVPVVIGLKLTETAQQTRFALELSDPVDARV